jgi:hypothetical protein
MLFALAVQALPVALLLFCRLPSPATRFFRLSAIALLLVVQPNQAVWLNTINSQFHLCVAAAVILISEPPSRAWAAARLCILGLAGLTGVVSCLLLPFFVVEYFLARRGHRLQEIVVLAAASIVQGAAVLSGPGRGAPGDFGLLAMTLLTKQWILPVLGSGAADAFGAYARENRLYEHLVPAILALIPWAAVGAGAILWGGRQARLLLAASVSIASVSFLQSVDAGSPGWLVGHLSALGAGRYYFAPNVLLAFALLLSPRTGPPSRAGGSRPFRVVCLAVMIAIFALGSIDFAASRKRHKWFFSGPSWPAEVEKWREGGEGALRIWPRPWTMELPAIQGPDPRAGARPGVGSKTPPCSDRLLARSWDGPGFEPVPTPSPARALRAPTARARRPTRPPRAG